MKVLVIHNYYKNSGGEDAVVESEINLLKNHGHEVIYYAQNNSRIDDYIFTDKLNTFLASHWSEDSYLSVKELINSKKPDIAHIHNTFLLVTPSVYFACRELGLPVVQTLHNYRFFCPNGKLYFKGRVCEHCLKHKNFLMSLARGCWRDSRLLSITLAWALSYHARKDTFKDFIDCYIALTEFSKNKFIEAGYLKDKIFVKPNFVDLSSVPEAAKVQEGYALFVGRISQEKGIKFLLDAWKSLNHIPLKIVGSGSLLPGLKRIALEKNLNISFEGEKSNVQAMNYIQNCSFLVFPSEWYETFGRVIIESFACSVPVIASRLGAMEELISHNQTGLLFRPGDIRDFIEKVNYLWENPQITRVMGQSAKEEYLNKYTPEANYSRLMEIYDKAIKIRRLCAV